MSFEPRAKFASGQTEKVSHSYENLRGEPDVGDATPRLLGLRARAVPWAGLELLVRACEHPTWSGDKAQPTVTPTTA